MKEANRVEEQALRKRKIKVEMEIERWISKYDQDMLEKQDQIDEINGHYRTEKEQLATLETRFQELKKEYDVIMEQRAIERARREAAENELAKMIRAALLLQAMWRAVRARRGAKKAAKKGGKGSKKKKKK